VPDDLPESAEHPHWVPSFGMLVVAATGVLVAGCCGLGWWLLSMIFREPLGPNN
jgi:hypothetical protein